MKRIATIAAIVVAAAGGHVARDYSNVGPLVEPPKATAIVVRGPEEGFAGREYFFHAEMDGDHGRPTWIVSPECDITTNDMGTLARLRCDEPNLYTLTVTVGGRDATVAADVRHFQVVDLQSEIDQAVAQATTTTELPLPTVSQLVQQLPSFPHDPQQRTTAAGVFRLMSQRIQAGLVPSDSDPIKLIQGQLGESYREFLTDVSGVVDQLRLTGEVTTAASFAPVLEEIAAALGG